MGLEFGVALPQERRVTGMRTSTAPARAREQRRWSANSWISDVTERAGCSLFTLAAVPHQTAKPQTDEKPQLEAPVKHPIDMDGIAVEATHENS
jgi:hypothetical protein